MNIELGRKQNTTVFIICLILVLALSYFPVFWRLDSSYLRLWDESRLAMNALEMSRNGNIIVTHFEGEPDMWNTKPPFLIWLQAISIKIFGINELAIRLPVAIAAFLTIISLFIFCARYLKNSIAGLLSSLILATTNGFIYYHVARHGEYDAVLILFTTLASLFFFIYSEAPAVKIRYLYLFTAMLFLGIMTKGIAACIFLPALLMYSFFTLKIKKMLVSKHLYINVLLLVSMVFGYYFLRNALTPGYIDAVLENEIFGRYMEVNEGHRGDFWYYFNDMHDNTFMPWLYFLLPAFFLLLFHKKNRFIRLSMYLVLWIISFFLIMSYSETKLWWYIAPVYPVAALLIGVAFGEIAQEFASRSVRWSPAIDYYLIISILAFLLLPYINIINEIKTPIKEYGNEMQYRDYLREYSKVFNEELTIATPGYNAHAMFYIEQHNAKGKDYKFNESLQDTLLPGEKVLVCEEAVLNDIKSKYNFDYFHQWKSCATLLIKAKVDTLEPQLQ